MKRNEARHAVKNKARTRRTRRSRLQLQRLEPRQLLAGDLTLELLHFTDQEAGAPAVEDAPNLSAVLNALRDQDLGNDGLVDNTLTLSSGDSFIPGLFFSASDGVYGSAGVADIKIQNELGVQAIGLGNHEFDLGTATLAGLISGAPNADTGFAGFEGAQFPYLSGNLNFDPDSNLSPLVVPNGGAPMPNSISGSVVIDVNGEPIGVVSAVTPTLGTISSPGDVIVNPAPFSSPPSSSELDALAAEIQMDVDALLAANPDMDKVILLAHMQQINVEFELASRLENVDIIVAGGSNTRLLDGNDRLRSGDTIQGAYPTFIDNPSGDPVAVVNTDGNYKYVGRLVIGFDSNGVIEVDSYDQNVSGAYATDAQGVADLGGIPDPEIVEIASMISDQIAATDGSFFGVTDVFLNGTRSDVRTQETNLGNLTADANLATAQQIDSSVVVSIKNGGGIRDNIGEIVVPPGGTEAVKLPPSENPISGRPEGGVSQNAIGNSLRFNNGLSLVTLTRSNLVEVLEHGVAATAPGATPGQFPQISGVKFSFDAEAPAGDRIASAAIVDESGKVTDVLVRDGELVGDAEQEVRIVTLNFLAGGGDGYPFPQGDEANRVDLAQDDSAPRTGVADFAPDGTEQDALAEYLAANFPAGSAFGLVDSDPSLDTRIQNLAFRSDSVLNSVVRGDTVYVTNEADTDVGSFRYAVGLASVNPAIKQVKFKSWVDDVEVGSPIVFSGKQDLKIDGARAVIKAADSFAGDGIFVSTAAADLKLKKITFDGDWQEGETAANGVLVPIPDDATGTVEISLDEVKLLNNGLFGLHVDDQPLDDSPVGSDAGINLELNQVVAINNGIAELDFDGVRVDDGGEGSIHAKITRSRIDGNGADGLELDERGPGGVYLTVKKSTFNDNGFFDIEVDPDDGLDIDESEAGDVYVYLHDVVISNNDDEGLDLDEAGEGDIDLIARDVVANGNTDDGIKATEEDGGSLNINLKKIRANRNGGDGVNLEELGDGNLNLLVRDLDAKRNGDEGLQADELDGGSLFGLFWRSDLSHNGDSGAQLGETGDGDLLVSFLFSDLEDNEGAGIKAEQEDDGNGLLVLLRTDLDGNEEGELDLDGVSVLGH